MIDVMDPRRIKKLVEIRSHPESLGGNVRKAAVFLLLCDLETDPSIFAILKADNKGYPWANQVALPGGRVDETDLTSKHTVYRELEEEVKITKPHVQFLGSIGHFMTISNTEIEVFTGVWDCIETIDFDTYEIARVLKLPIIELCDVHNRKKFYGRVPDYSELMYPVDDVVVWGATARILHYFLELVTPCYSNNN